MKLNLAMARLLRFFLEDPAVPQFGWSLCQRFGVGSGTMFPMLRRLEAAGFVIAEREQADLSVVQRPARIYYRLTEAGHQFAWDELTRLASQLQPPASAAPAGGSA